MTWADSNSYSYGVDAFLSRLSANGQPTGSRAYPNGVERSTLRFQGGETIKQWFARCVAAFMTGPHGLEYWRLEENLAAFAHVSWDQGNRLEYATINILKTECSLEDYLSITDEDLEKREWEELSKPSYLRLDLDYGTLGPIGTHPLPHIHFSPDDPPRFTLDAGRSSNVVVDFIDFIYRHYFPGTWRSWAEQAWNKHYRGQNRDPENNPFNVIISSYNESRIGVIRCDYFQLQREPDWCHSLPRRRYRRTCVCASRGERSALRPPRQRNGSTPDVFPRFSMTSREAVDRTGSASGLAGVFPASGST